MAGSPGSDGRPDPSAAGTVAEFVDALRRLKDWSGLGFRRLEQRAAAAGQVLPRSTITAAFNRDTLPREDLVVALVRTCGGDQDEVDRWVATRRRIAAAPAPPGSSKIAPPPARSSSARRAAGLAVVAALLITAGLLLGADFGADTSPDASPGIVNADAGQSASPATDQATTERALALFAMAE